MSGYLDITIGCMFSGKTSKLIAEYNYLKILNKVIAVNHSFDTRYNDLKDFSHLVCHDQNNIPCIMFSDLHHEWFNTSSKFYRYLHNNDFILINEAQFFDNLKEVVLDMLKHNKKVYLYGLDGDYRQQKFGEILDLIPYCDNIEKLIAKCVKCNEYAIFSQRLNENTDQVLVSSTCYIPVCRKCFTTFNT